MHSLEALVQWRGYGEGMGSDLGCVKMQNILRRINVTMMAAGMGVCTRVERTAQV